MAGAPRREELWETAGGAGEPAEGCGRPGVCLRMESFSLVWTFWPRVWLLLEKRGPERHGSSGHWL